LYGFLFRLLLLGLAFSGALANDPNENHSWNCSLQLCTLPANYIAYGDSVTAGIGVSSPLAAYPNLIAVETRRRLSNRAVSGDRATDFSYRVFSDPLPSSASNTVVTVAIGTNDIGASQAGLATYDKALMAGLAWVALRKDYKHLANTGMRVGKWMPKSIFPGLQSLISSGPEDELIFRGIQIGRHGVFYVWFGMAAEHATFSVFVDGRVVLDEIGRSSTIETSSRSDPPRSAPTSVGLARFMVTPGKHDIEIAKLGSNVSLVGIGVPFGDGRAEGLAPLVAVGGVIPEEKKANDLLVLLYNAAAAKDSMLLRADGLRTPFVNLYSAIDPVLDMTGVTLRGCIGNAPYDGLHPNDCGQRRLANAFEAVLRLASH
jgi:lysophospholipase L1-like esterase